MLQKSTPKFPHKPPFPLARALRLAQFADLLGQVAGNQLELDVLRVERPLPSGT